MKKVSNLIKEIIKNVNGSMKVYEAEWVSIKRTPYSDKERIHSLQQFLECRLNMEFYFVPELEDIINDFDGHLIVVSNVTGEDPKKKRFESAVAYVNLSSYHGTFPNDVILERLERLIGGKTIQFTYSLKRPKIYITK